MASRVMTAKLSAVIMPASIIFFAKHLLLNFLFLVNATLVVSDRASSKIMLEFFIVSLPLSEFISWNCLSGRLAFISVAVYHYVAVCIKASIWLVE